MYAEKKQGLVTSMRIVLPPRSGALKQLAERFNVADCTIKNYLNVSNNRTSQKAIDVQIAAINDYGGKLVEHKAFDTSILVCDDDNHIIYELK